MSTKNDKILIFRTNSKTLEKSEILMTMFKKKSKNFLNFLLEPSGSKMDHKKAINEN